MRPSQGSVELGLMEICFSILSHARKGCSLVQPRLGRHVSAPRLSGWRSFRDTTAEGHWSYRRKELACHENTIDYSVYVLAPNPSTSTKGNQREHGRTRGLLPFGTCRQTPACPANFFLFVKEGPAANPLASGTARSHSPTEIKLEHSTPYRCTGTRLALTRLLAP